MTHIAAIADGQEKTVQLPRTKYDGTLTKSIISREKVRATKGTTKSVSPTSLVDANDQAYSSNTAINLRWYVKGTAQSFSETFYVVDSCGTYDAMLRKDVRRPRADNFPEAYPLMMNESKADKERRIIIERQRLREMEQSKKNTQERVRAQVDAQRRQMAAARR
jgi:hypothetical protein